MRPTWKPPRDERGEPADRYDRRNEEGPHRQNEVVRDDERCAQEDREPAAPERLGVSYPDSLGVHGSGYRTPVRRVCFLVLAAALLAGCGGGGGGDEALTKEKYASEADAICGKYNKQVKAIDNPTTLDELVDVSDKTIPILGDAIRDLRKLEPPPDEQAKANEWLDRVETLKGDLEKIRDRAKDNDLQGVQAVVPVAEEHNNRANELATELGMHVCNRD